MAKKKEAWTKAPGFDVLIFFFAGFHIVDLFGPSAGVTLVKDFCVSFLCLACINFKALR